MTQFAKPTLVATTDDGTTLAAKFNGAIGALYSMHSGATAPASPTEGQGWVDTSQISGTPKRVTFRTFQAGAWYAIGTLDMDANLYTVTGGVPSSGGTLTGPMLFPFGTAAAPSIAFAGNTNTGIFRIAANSIGFTTNGVQRVALTGTSFDIATGNMSLSGASSTFNIDRAGSAGWSQINWRVGTSNRFVARVSGAESTGNAGSSFNLLMFDDAGTQIVNFMNIQRNTRQMGINGTFIGSATVGIRSNDGASAAYDAIECMNTSTAADAYASINLRTASGALRAAIRGERPGSTNHGDLGIWTGVTGVLTKAATFRSNNDLDVVGQVNAPSFNGVLVSPTGGKIRSFAGINDVTFGWQVIGTGAQLFYRIDGANDRTLPTATNATGFTYAAGGGGPTGVAFNGLSFAGDFFGIFVDAISDERVKENIRPTEVDALGIVASVPVRAFDVKAEVAAWQSTIGLAHEQRVERMANAKAAPIPIGFVTQELGARVPEAINTPPASHKQPEGSPLPDDCQTYSPEALVPYLWRAIQQQQEMISALTSRIASLEATK
jgi:hypothetical protein